MNYFRPLALLTFAFWTCPQVAQAQEIKISFGTAHKPQTPDNIYFKAARGFLDAMLTHGRDTYGLPSPMFVGTLNLDKMAAVAIDPSKKFNVAANPNEEVDLYRHLYAMSHVTGDRKYAQAADSALHWFMGHSGTKAGFMGWGEHGSCGLDGTRNGCSSQNCEHSSSPTMMDDYWRLGPERLLKASKAYWDVGIGDKEKGYFDRHCGPTAVGAEFPRHGGYYMLYWGEAYKRTGDASWLKYIDVLRKYFDGARLPGGEFPSSRTGTSIWAGQNISLITNAWNILTYLPQDLPLREELRKFCLKTDDALERHLVNGVEPKFHKWDEHGFIRYIQGYSRYWQLRDAGEHVRAETYKTGLLKTAANFIGNESNVKWAGSTGFIIELMVYAHRLSGDAKYLAGAKKYADIALDRFFNGRPIPADIYGPSLVEGNIWYYDNGYSTNNNCYTPTLPLAMFMLGIETAGGDFTLFMTGEGT